MARQKFRRNCVTFCSSFSKVIDVRIFDASRPPALPVCCESCGSRAIALREAALCPRCAMALALAAGAEAEELPNELFPELEIEGPLGSGGFGHVWKAQHRRLQRAVALKSLDHLLARSPESRALFSQEMAVVGRLDHPGIVRAYDAGEREGYWYLLTEYIDGMDTGALVRRHGRLPVAEACEIVRQAALALHYAHGLGLVHRDVKPGNLMITRGGDGPARVKVLDFGLAAYAGVAAHTGGTPGYTAPETARAGAVADARADLYALGATLRRFLSGTAAQGAGGEVSVQAQRARLSATAPVPLAAVASALPGKLAALCDRCMATDPAERPQSAAELAALLAPWARGAELVRLFHEGPLAEKPRPALWRRHPVAAGAVAAACAVLAAVLLWTRLHSPEKTVVPAAMVVPSARPVFSPALMEDRQLTAEIAPRLLTEDWVPDLEIPCIDPIAAARFLPDRRVAYLYDGPQGLEIRAQGEAVESKTIPLGKGREIKAIAADAASGRVLWTELNQREGVHLGRADTAGNILPGLRFNFEPEFPPGAFDLTRRLLLQQGKEVSDASPWGLTTVLPGQIADNTGLQPGDVLIADAGHRNFGVTQGQPGLWRCRAEADAPAERLGTLPVDHHYPIDVTVSRHGVFLLNRGETMPSQPESNPWNKESRIYRWDRGGFHVCRLRQPLHDPSGLAADPLSTDLYAIQGALLPSASIAFQRVLRLRLVAPDEYEITPVADRFGKFSPCGIAFSADGQRLVLTDQGNRVIVGLRKRSR
jgi:hypothetical protein